MESSLVLLFIQKDEQVNTPVLTWKYSSLDKADYKQHEK